MTDHDTIQHREKNEDCFVHSRSSDSLRTVGGSWGRMQVLPELVDTCRSHNVTDIVIVHEHRGEPDGLVVCHLPYGPTAYFGIFNTVRVLACRCCTRYCTAVHGLLWCAIQFIC